MYGLKGFGKGGFLVDYLDFYLKRGPTDPGAADLLDLATHWDHSQVLLLLKK